MLEEFVNNEYKELAKNFNPTAKIKKVLLNFTNEKFFKDFKHIINTDRRGEVGFILKRKNGKYVVIRSKRYPKNIYRIPTGGIGFSESVYDALKREVKEELGVTFSVNTFIGILEYQVSYKEEKLKFYSFLFEIDEESGILLKDATEDEISGFLELSKGEMFDLVFTLQNIDDGWKDWSLFRNELLIFFKEYYNK